MKYEEQQLVDLSEAVMEIIADYPEGTPDAEMSWVDQLSLAAIRADQTRIQADLDALK